MKSQLYVATDIIDINKDFGIGRPAKVTYGAFLKRCIMKPKQTEKIASEWGVTEKEFKHFNNRIASQQVFLLLGIMVIVFSYWFFQDFHRHFTVTMIMTAILAILIVAAVWFMKRLRIVEQGMMFHGINYNYISCQEY